MSHFKLISSTKASEVIPINKYVSEKTGITVIIANVEGPLVNGYFCLATEADDDDGLPHTLEHLIFLGSERYPYKGILDLLANRCMAHGTNAWTDTDHTCYTIDTAGDEGMLALLPIYLDHILRPTLTEHAFTTEVHHIDGDGEDSGVVYCEMQGRENSADSRCELRLLRALYPGNAYSAQTGGIMHNLRTSTDNKKVIDFHKRFYRAENLTIILTGQIKANDVFKALAVVEDDILAKREKERPEPWVKPWQTIPPPAHFGEYQEQWPCDTEDCGQIVLGWRGPVLTDSNSQTELSAVAIIQRYLCETASAPLQKCLVEREDALAGDVSYNITENLVAAIKIECDNVPIAKLTACRDEALNCLRKVRDGDEAIDMERLRRLTRKQIREAMASLEADPHHAVAFRAIGDAIYSRNEEDFINRMNPQISLRELLNKEEAYWRGLMQKYFTDDIVIIMGSPSVELQAKMADEEKKRIEEQRSILGEAGLAEKTKVLEDAMAFNERPPPDGTLRAFPVPSCTNLKFHNISSWHSGGETCPHMDLSKIPLYTRLQSLNTNFVYINIILDTTSVDINTRKWLPIHMNGLAECPVIRGGKLIPHEEVISTTERLTVMFCNNIGFGKAGNFSVGSFGNLLHIATRCEPDDYDEVVNHLFEILYSVEITKERLLVFAQRMLNDIAQVRRNGHKMVYDLLRDSLYSTDSNIHWNSVLRQTKFLKELIDRLNAGGDSAQSVIEEAKETLRKITANAWLHMTSDFERYKLSADPWKVFSRGTKPVKEPTLYNDRELMSKFGGGFVVGVGGVESTFLNQFSPGPADYSNAVVAPLMLALNYFTQLEGPMWRLIRGSGLSYGYGIRHLPNEASHVFSLYRATNAIAAYNKVKTIVDDFLKGGEFDEDLFASAKSTALFEVVENEKCPADVVHQSLMHFVQRVSNNYSRELICAIASVTPEEARKAAEQWLPLLFDSAKSKVSIVCHPTKVKDIQAAFEKVNVKLEAYESLEQTHYNQ